jgi:hypothetical protein
MLQQGFGGAGSAGNAAAAELMAVAAAARELKEAAVAAEIEDAIHACPAESETAIRNRPAPPAAPRVPPDGALARVDRRNRRGRPRTWAERSDRTIRLDVACSTN